MDNENYSTTELSQRLEALAFMKKFEASLSDHLHNVCGKLDTQLGFEATAKKMNELRRYTEESVRDVKILINEIPASDELKKELIVSYTTRADSLLLGVYSAYFK